MRISDVPAFREQFNQTSIGRLRNDEQVRPILTQLYGSAVEAFAGVEKEMGLSLDQLLALPQGEAAVGVVVPPQGPLALVAILNFGDKFLQVQQLVDAAAQQLQRQGYTETTIRSRGATLSIWESGPGAQRQHVAYFVDDATVVLTTNAELGKQLLQVWTGEAEGELHTLADDSSFNAVMARCTRSQEHPPQVTFYVNPLEFAKAATRGNFNLQATLTVLEVLGLDGLLGVGGSLTLGADDYDIITQAYIHLDSPREGVLQAIALDRGEIAPEPWVPKDAATYTTIHWDVLKTYDKILEMLDSFRGQGVTAAQARAIVDRRLGVDLESDLLAALDGRVTLVSWMEPPARINSQANLIGIKLKDPVAFRGTLQTMLDKNSAAVETDTFAGVTYHRLNRPNRGEAAGQGDMRQPEPCLAVVGDYLLFADSLQLFKNAMLARNEASRSLANELDYKLIASKIRKEAAGGQAGMASFRRPEEAMRVLWEMAGSEGTRDRLARQAEQSPLAAALLAALKENPLPPFAAVVKYLAPGGGLMLNEERGIYYLGFSLKREH